MTALEQLIALRRARDEAWRQFLAIDAAARAATEEALAEACLAAVRTEAEYLRAMAHFPL